MMMQGPAIYSIDSKELGWSKSHLSLLLVLPEERMLPPPLVYPGTHSIVEGCKQETVIALLSGENFLAFSPGSHSGADYEVSHRVLERLLLGVWDYPPCQPFNVQSLWCVKCPCVCVAVCPLVSVKREAW